MIVTGYAWRRSSATAPCFPSRTYALRIKVIP
jgi:hypothetical protein